MVSGEVWTQPDPTGSSEVFIVPHGLSYLEVGSMGLLYLTSVCSLPSGEGL